MASKKLTMYRGKTLKELNAMSLDEVADLLPARARRCISRPQYWDAKRKKLLKDLRAAKDDMNRGVQTQVRTHIRDFIILPEFVGLTVQVYSGKEFVPIEITLDRVGDYFAEYAQARKIVKHSAPGIGATRSSMFVPLK